MHCPDHPAYKGDRELKQKSRVDCPGCQKVRQAYLVGMKKRKNAGKGGQFSITSPGFRCSIAHLFAEIGTIVLFGHQPAFFWRVGTKANPKAKEHFKKVYQLLSNSFGRDQDLYRQVKGLLWQVWERDYHAGARLQEHIQSIEACESKEVEEPVAGQGMFQKTHINPLLYGDEDGKEESSQ